MYTSFFVLVISFLVGVFWRSLFDIGVAGVGTLIAIGLMVLALTQYERFRHTLYIVLALVACVIGIVRTEMAYEWYEQARIYEEGVVLETEGVIAAEPDTREEYTVIWIDTESNGLKRGVRVRAKVPLYPELSYGDRVEVSGVLRVPTAFLTDTGRTFDYAGFLMKDGIHYELRKPKVALIASGYGNTLVSALLSLKQAWLSAVSRLIPEPEASLAGGVIVGAKRSLGDEWLEAFRVTGIIHIVVLSGYNLTLVANSVVRMASKLPRVWALILGTVGVACFALMTGGGATVVRASMMAVLGMLAVYLVRPHILLRALAFAAFLMVLWNPFVLAFDTGFQLSFVATLGLIVGAPLVSRWFVWVPETLQFREILAATIATQIAVLPLLLYQIGLVSLVAPLVNVLVLPLVPFAMLFGFLAGAVGMVSSVLAWPFAWLAHLMLSYVFWVVDLFARFEFAAVALPPVPWWFIVGLYALLGGWVTYLHKTTRIRAGGVVDAV